MDWRSNIVAPFPGAGMISIHRIHQWATLFALIMFAADAAAATAYPVRPVRWIVPAAAGGGADSSVRIIAPELSRLLGQQVVIDNRPGASGTIGVNMIAKAADGYTFGSGNITNIAMNGATGLALPYSVDDELQAVVQTHFQPNVLVVALTLPVKSVGELIEFAKKSPSPPLYASSGVGSSLHFAAELFRMMSGAPIRHVPYNSVTVALSDLIGGRVPVIFDNVSSSAPHIKGNRVRGLAVTATRRSPLLPELPTVAESGVPGYEVTIWSGMIIGAGTPKTIVDQLNKAVNRALEDSLVKERLTTNLGLQLVGGSAEQFTRLIRSEERKWKDVAQKAGIRAD
jgi:tripartite-type tricarboxylate transporter receptor subunit TctC